MLEFPDLEKKQPCEKCAKVEAEYSEKYERVLKELNQVKNKYSMLKQKVLRSKARS